MRIGGDDGVVKLGVEIETEEAARKLEAFRRTVVDFTENTTVPMQAGGGNSGNLFSQYTAAGTVLGAPPPSLNLPAGPNQGVWLGGGSYYSGSVAMAPGALAPDPYTGRLPGAATGQVPGVVAAGGNIPISGGQGGQTQTASSSAPTTIIAGSITIMGAAPAGWPHGASIPSVASPAGSSGGGNGGAGGGAPSPLPNWNPFGDGGNAPLGFHGALSESLPGGWGGMLGKRFLQGSPVGQQLMHLGGEFGQFMPEGAGEMMGGMLGKAAPLLGVAMMAREALSIGLQTKAAYEMPGIYQGIRERSVERSGRLYDPLQLTRDRRIADIEARDNATEAIYNSGPGRMVRWFAPWVEYQHDTDYRRKVDQAKTFANSDMEYDEAARQFRFSTGAQVGKGNKRLTERAAYNEGLGSLFAYGQGKNSFSLDYDSYGEFGNVPGEVGASSSRIAGYLTQPGYERQADMASRGVDVRAFSPQVIASAIARGDYDTLKALGPEFTRMAGGDLNAGLRMQQNAMARALALSATRTQSAIGQSHLSGGQAEIGLMAANGASGYALAGLTSQLAGSYDSIISGAQANLSAQKATGNPLEIARAQAELMQARAAQAQMRKGAAMQTFQTRETELGALGAFAGAALNRAMFGNSESSVMQAFDKQDAVLRGRVGNALMMSRSRFLSPEERAGYAAEAANLRNQSEFDLPRQRGDYRLGLASGRLGVAGARAGSALEHAGLYGGVEEQLHAALGMANVTKAQMALVSGQIAGDNGPKTQQERLDLQRQQIELQKQLNSALEQAARNYQSANLSVAQFSQGMASSSANYRQSFFGVGGAAAGVEHGEVVDAARKTLSVAQANFDRVRDLPKDNQYRQQRERELVDAKMNSQAAVQGYAGLSPGVDLERAYAAGQYELSVMTGTYAQWGDIRGATEGLLKNVGQQGKALWAQRAQGLAAIASDTSLSEKEKQERKSVLLRDFEMRQYDLGRQSIGLQQQVETGWQGRLTSSIVNSPSRGTFVAAGFTQREAARFMQTQSAIFGFSGPGAEDARDYHMHKGIRLANSTIGNVTRPQGFIDTGMAFAAGGGHGVLSAPLVGPVHFPASGGGGGNYGRNDVAYLAQELARATSAQAQAAARLASAMANAGRDNSGRLSPFGNPGHAGARSNVANNWNSFAPHYANGTSHQ